MVEKTIKGKQPKRKREKQEDNFKIDEFEDLDISEEKFTDEDNDFEDCLSAKSKAVELDDSSDDE